MGFEVTQGKFQNSSPCPNCGARLDAWTGLDRRSPKQGDVSICGYCGIVLVFSDDQGSLRAPTASETQNIMTTPSLEKNILQSAARSLQAQKARRAWFRN